MSDDKPTLEARALILVREFVRTGKRDRVVEPNLLSKMADLAWVVEPSLLSKMADLASEAEAIERRWRIRITYWASGTFSKKDAEDFIATRPKDGVHYEIVPDGTPLVECRVCQVCASYSFSPVPAHPCPVADKAKP